MSSPQMIRMLGFRAADPFAFAMLCPPDRGGSRIREVAVWRTKVLLGQRPPDAEAGRDEGLEVHAPLEQRQRIRGGGDVRADVIVRRARIEWRVEVSGGDAVRLYIDV